jgi:hypothetical protein
MRYSFKPSSVLMSNELAFREKKRSGNCTRKKSRGSVCVPTTRLLVTSALICASLAAPSGVARAGRLAGSKLRQVS